MARPKHDARAADSALAAASAAPAGGDAVAPATPTTGGEKAGEDEGTAAASISPSSAEPVPASGTIGARIDLSGFAFEVGEVDATRAVADRIVQAATPVVKVVASRARWRARCFWPQGETDLTVAECEQLGEAGFAQLRADPVFTIVPLYAD